MKKMLLCLLPALLVCPVHGRIITVDCNDPTADCDSIQCAIEMAANGDIIIVEPCVYIENISFKGKNVRLQSRDPGLATVRDSTVIVAPSGYAVRFESEETSGAIITGFTITGGGIYCQGTSPVIKDNVVTDCNTTGIVGEWSATRAPTPTILGNVITHNRPSGISGCGGLIQGNTISFNGNGGGLVSCDGTITQNLISYNRSASSGGGLFQCNGPVRQNVIIGNNSGNHGGAASNCRGQFTYNIITGNRSTRGGGLYVCDGRISSNTIVGNRAEEGAAIAYCSGLILNNIIAFNEAVDAGGIFGPADNAYNSFWANVGGDYGQGASAGVGDGTRDPRFVDPGGWDPNGTPADPADDFWVNGDYHLRSENGRWDGELKIWVYDNITSQCIDAAEPGPGWMGEFWPHGERMNPGRYGGTAEASMSLVLVGNVADLNLDGVVDFRDVRIFGTRWPRAEELLREDLDRDGRVDVVDYSILVANWQPLPLPSPSPMRWEIVPYAVSPTVITMSAVDATSSDGTSIEYYFDEVTGNPGGQDSGWQSSKTYTNYSLEPGTQYAYRVQVRNSGNHLRSDWSAVHSVVTFKAPTPNPSTWAIEPNAISDSEITMTATLAVAGDGTTVQYKFLETGGAPGGDDSDWQDSPVYTDSGLQSQTTYCYRVKARNKGDHFETELSVERCATTKEPPRPLPSPMQWSIPPTAVSETEITMRAFEAISSDGSGVEYLFEETSGSPGGSNSTWQDAREFTDTDLSPMTTYSYRVKARNKGNHRETEWSVVASATTDHERIPPEPDPMEWEIEPHEVYHGGSTEFNWYAEMQAVEATDENGPIEYRFVCTTNDQYSSGWQRNRYYEVRLGRRFQRHRFKVQARDKYGNETRFSTEVEAN